jgi:FtsZ-binding cell division protein ZapB
MFEGIGSYATMGTMNSFLQQKKLRIAANYKVKTGQRLSDAMRAPSSRDLVESMMKNRRKTEDEASKQRVALIKQKLMSGKRISQTELEYLRDRDTSLYRKAKKAEESREELQARLRNCKTKQEARMAVSQAMVKAAAETGAELAAAKGAAGGGGGAASGALPAAGGQAGPGMEGVSVGAENAAVTEGAASEMTAASAARETADGFL